MRRIFLVKRMTGCVVVKAAGWIKNIRRRSVDVLETSLEITDLPADQPLQRNIGIIIPRIEPIQIQLSKSLNIPFLVPGLIAVFRVCKYILGIDLMSNPRYGLDLGRIGLSF